MKKPLLSVIFLFAFALASVIGIGMQVNAQEITVGASMTLAEDITVNFEMRNLPTSAQTVRISSPAGQHEQDIISAPIKDGARKV